MREMLSVPLQQLAYVYNYEPNRMTMSQRGTLHGYFDEDVLGVYRDLPSISDTLKSAFDVSAFKRNPGDFAALYLKVGFQAPIGYAKAFYLQNLGLLYLDKSYPDTRIWHHYLNYAGYGQDVRAFNPAYILIERHSLFPAYDEYLKYLFGHDPSEFDAVSGDSPAFSSIPVLNVLCRVSTYFWVLLFMAFVGFYRRWHMEFLLLGLLLGLTATVLLAPLVLYRYYAAVVFAIPVLLVLFARSPGEVPMRRRAPGSLCSRFAA